jgi:excisionase family DNA binding protein
MKKFKLDGINYSLDNSEITVEPTKTQYEGDIVIPSFIVFRGEKYEVTKISWYAFFRCKNLKSLVLPETIKSIGNRVFEGCNNLESLTLKVKTPFAIDNYTFDKNKPDLYVPAGCVEAYSRHESWTEFAISTIPDSKEKEVMSTEIDKIAYQLIEASKKTAIQLTEIQKEKSALIEKIEAIEKKNIDLQIKQDNANEWLTIKKVGQLNKIFHGHFDWKKLKANSFLLGFEPRKIEDSNYPDGVNTYHISVWKKTYPQLNYKFENDNNQLSFLTPSLPEPILPKVETSLLNELVLIRQLLEKEKANKLQKLYTVKEFAEYIGTDVRFIDKIIKDHNIKVLTISERNRRIKESEIVKYINSIQN